MKTYNSIFGILAALLLSISMTVNADIGNTTTQQVCTQLGTDNSPMAPISNAAWNAGGLNRALDRQEYNVDIVAYKIKWFSAGWSDWFVKGVNDLYPFTTPDPTNPANVDARLAWIYFVDHQFQVIYCS